MRIVITGGTGFLGQALSASLAARGDQVAVLSRSGEPAPPAGRIWDEPGIRTWRWTATPDLEGWRQIVDGAGAVVNLAGESIASGRWTAARKARIERSRLDATAAVVAAIRTSAAPPSRLISGSAVGYYGSRRGADLLTEASPAADEFLGSLARRWEEVATEAQLAGCAVSLVRTGIVLDPREGVLASLSPVFKLFAGGPAGSGAQYMSWIHRDDWVALVTWLLDRRDEGPFNATAPNPVTNAEFSLALGRVLGRPSWLPTPGFVLRAMLGEMADALLLGGQRVLPARAMAAGFTFRFNELGDALRDLYGREIQTKPGA